MTNIKNKNHFEKTIYFEEFCLKKLAKHLRISEIEVYHKTKDKGDASYDLENGNIKYDVKYSNLSRVRKDEDYFVWDFDIRYKTEYCDYLLLLGLENNEPKKLFLVPLEDAPSRRIRIKPSKSYKWEYYLIWQK